MQSVTVVLDTLKVIWKKGVWRTENGSFLFSGYEEFIFYLGSMAQIFNPSTQRDLWI